ncbi:MAG TPA: cytochrome P450 [Trebonia sp.]|nr:cytochrome P450 [Trebonia sp.]
MAGRGRLPVVEWSEDDCAAVLADPAFGHAPASAASPLRAALRPGPSRDAGPGNAADHGVFAEVNARSMLRMNPPDHTRLRRLVSGAFTPARVRELVPRIEAITAELLADPGPRFDLIGQLALPLPVRVISELLGIPEADRPKLVTWSEQLSRSLDPGFLLSPDVRATMRVAREGFHDYLAALIQERRRAPGSDLVSGLVQVHDSSGRLTEDEIITPCRLLLIAGHETTRSLIGGGVLALLRNPAQLAALASDPGRTDSCVEEVLRYDPPVQLLIRYALREAKVGDVVVPAGAVALMLVGAANRDEALGESPDAFDITRGARGHSASRHLAFGHGIHFCLGAPLARVEAAIALRHLLPVLPGCQLAEPPQWKPHTVLRGLEHLWLARP